MTRTLKERTFSGTTNPEIQPWEIEHRKLARLAAAEGIVLLKNEEHVLPLKAGSAVAIYRRDTEKNIWRESRMAFPSAESRKTRQKRSAFSGNAFGHIWLSNGSFLSMYSGDFWSGHKDLFKRLRKS